MGEQEMNALEEENRYLAQELNDEHLRGERYKKALEEIADGLAISNSAQVLIDIAEKALKDE